MKEVYIIIRPNKYQETKAALIENNFHSMSVKDILGRGKKSVQFSAGDGSQECVGEGSEVNHPFIPKKMVEIFCRDEDLDLLIETVSKVNKSGNSGDGKIIVIDVEDGIRIRTGEKNINAIM